MCIIGTPFQMELEGELRKNERGKRENQKKKAQRREGDLKRTQMETCNTVMFDDDYL